MENKARKVTTISNLTPEETAFAIGRYSRSGKGIREVLKELSVERKASNFLQKFAVNYGHESLRDLATINMAIEDISMLAAIDLEHEQLWNGQERSTRYQDFSKPNYYTPDSLSDNDEYKEYVERLFEFYSRAYLALDKLTGVTNMYPTSAAHAEAVKAKRAHLYDIIRVLLPYSALTSVGQITSARTLQKQISRIRASDNIELVEIGIDMANAAVGESLTPEGAGPQQASTLLKYASSNLYKEALNKQVPKFIEGIVYELLNTTPMQSPSVELGIKLTHMQEVVATYTYKYTDFSYNQIANVVRHLTNAEINVIYNNILELRGPHDEIPSEFRTGYDYIFDVLTDGKTMQDLYRHRRCVQIRQNITAYNGYQSVSNMFQTSGIYQVSDVTEPEMCQLISDFDDLLKEAEEHYFNLSKLTGPTEASYVLPMGYRRRSLFKMDSAEAAYIIETRSQLQGHFSYRWIAQKMFDIILKDNPVLAQNIRLVHYTKGDFLKR